MKYKKGDEFPATVVISCVNKEFEEYSLIVKGLEGFDFLDVTEEELLEAVDPEYKKQKLLEERKRIDKELKKLGNV